MDGIKKLNTLALTLLITGSIDSIRNLPVSALFGTTLIFFLIFSAIIFLIPAALVSAELSANVDEGGVYQWGRIAFGDRIGFLTIWLQWIANVVWFPTILSFVAGTAAYLVDPALGQNKLYLVSVILISFWGITLINLKGIRISAKFASFCAVFGLIVPLALIIGLFAIWLAWGHPIQLHLTAANMLPSFSHTDNWIALIAIMVGFSGMELATVHIKDVDEPQRTFPKALAISAFVILITMALGSLAIAFVLPYDQINLVNGTVQTFQYFLSAYHLSWFMPFLTILIVLGTLGGVVSWVASPAKGLAQAAKHGFLPPFFAIENKHGAPKNILIGQAFLVSAFCSAYLLIPSVNGSYWLLTALSSQLYTSMYAIMFLCGLRMRYKVAYPANGFTIPGKKFGLWTVCLLGLFACALTISIGFIPPNNIDIGTKLSYEMIFCTGLLAMTLPVLFLCWYRDRDTSSIMINDEDSPLTDAA
jgi:amino acid transporter